MKERGIIMQSESVRAILAGSKTQTRRTVKIPPSPWPWEPRIMTCDGLKHADGTPASFPPYPELTNARTGKSITCPYGAVGDRLWVRETWDFRDWSNDGDGKVRIAFAADGTQVDCEAPRGWNPAIYSYERWRPSIFMPRWASRITLEIVDVRVERLQAITEEDARAEGIAPLPLQEGEPGCWWTADASAGSALHGRTARNAFEKLWQSINAKRAPSSSNPWVWALTFKRVTP